MHTNMYVEDKEESNVAEVFREETPPPPLRPWHHTMAFTNKKNSQFNRMEIVNKSKTPITLGAIINDLTLNFVFK